MIPGDKEHRNDAECTVFEPPAKLAITAMEKEGRFVTTYVLTTEDSGTKVEKTMDMPKPKGFLGVMFPLEYLWRRWRYRRFEHPGFWAHIKLIARTDYRKA